jgi:small GTP-binding protein
MADADDVHDVLTPLPRAIRSAPADMMQQQQQDQHDGVDRVVLKFVVIGPLHSGKTTLLNRFIKYNENKRDMTSSSSLSSLEPCSPTVGVGMAGLQRRRAGRLYQCNFFDTSGEERYNAIASSYYANVAGILYVFDIHAFAHQLGGPSVQHLDVSQIKAAFDAKRTHDCVERFGKHPKLVMIGNKTDLWATHADNRLARAVASLDDLCEQYDAKLFDLSAYYVDTLCGVFDYLIESVIDCYEKNTNLIEDDNALSSSQSDPSSHASPTRRSAGSVTNFVDLFDKRRPIAPLPPPPPPLSLLTSNDNTATFQEISICERHHRNDKSHSSPSSIFEYRHQLRTCWNAQ